MERGRFSKEYAQFLADRFYRRYKATCYLQVPCTVKGCNEIGRIRANAPDEEYDNATMTFKCPNCSSKSKNSE